MVIYKYKLNKGVDILSDRVKKLIIDTLYLAWILLLIISLILGEYKYSDKIVIIVSALIIPFYWNMLSNKE